MIYKGDPFYSDWRVGHGGVGGALSTIESYSGQTAVCAASTYAQSDLQHFQVWVGSLGAGSGAVIRNLSSFVDGVGTGWQNRWSLCGTYTQGSVSSASAVSIGSSLYNGDVMEILVWKGVALK